MVLLFKSPSVVLHYLAHAKIFDQIGKKKSPQKLPLIIIFHISFVAALFRQHVC